MTMQIASLCLLVMLATFSLYAIIASGRHRLFTFILTPIIILSSIISVYAIYSLQGTAIEEIPQGEITIVSVAIAQPNIHVLVVKQGDSEPTYYKFEYSKQRAEQMQEILLRQRMQMSTTGEFETKSGNQGNSKHTPGDLIFKPVENKSLIPKG
jgi:hypothetical protein